MDKLNQIIQKLLIKSITVIIGFKLSKTRPTKTIKLDLFVKLYVLNQLLTNQIIERKKNK